MQVPITKEMDVAIVEVGDDYSVELWQMESPMSYTPDEARELARQLVEAADGAETIEAADQRAAFGDDECRPFTVGGEAAI